jgi:hypothetical protein
MLRVTFTIVLLVHGLIHLLGFLKAFKFAELEQLSKEISKQVGMLWLTTSILFLIAFLLMILHKDIWWLAGISAIIISQVTIILSWNDAKYGSLPNLIILIVVAIAYGVWNFNQYALVEQQNILADVDKNYSKLELTDLENLPLPVKNWVIKSGAVGKIRALSVRLEQSTKMRLEPDQVDWYDGEAVQYFTVDKPAFIWTVNMDINPFVFVKGRDYFKDGRGRMLIKLYSLFNVVDVANEKIDQGTMQRYLGEIVWFPSAVMSPYIKWESIDSLSAKAKMTYNGTSVEADFYFDESGEFKKFIALRYMGNDKNAKKYPWIITSNKSEFLNGIKIPVDMDATWQLPEGDFNWLKLKITRMDYNI